MYELRTWEDSRGFSGVFPRDHPKHFSWHQIGIIIGSPGEVAEETHHFLWLQVWRSSLYARQALYPQTNRVWRPQSIKIGQPLEMEVQAWAHSDTNKNPLVSTWGSSNPLERRGQVKNTARQKNLTCKTILHHKGSCSQREHTFGR